MFEFDGGLMNLALECEMINNNLEKELMREEARYFLEEENGDDSASASSDSGFKAKAKKFMDGLKELWGKIIAVVKQVINKVVVASGVAHKFIAKYGAQLNGFKNSNETVQVTELIVKPELLKQEYATVEQALKLSAKFLSIKIDASLENDIKNLQTDVKGLNERLVSVNNKKVSAKLTGELVRDAVQFIDKQYKGLVSPLNQVRENSNKVFKTAVQKYDYLISNSGEFSQRERNLYLAGYIHAGRFTLGLLMKSMSKFVGMLNQVYADSFAICRKAISASKKGIEEKDVEIIDKKKEDETKKESFESLLDDFEF